MLKKLMALFVITILLSSLGIKNANAATTFQAGQFPYKELQIQVMPEFDAPADWPKNTPAFLVGLYGTITNKSGKDYSGQITVPIPVNDKNFEINVVGEFSNNGNSETNRPYTIDKKNGTISWTPAKPIKNNAAYNYVIEYYTETIAGTNNKSFTYQYTSPASIGTLEVVFYAPMKATNIKLQPAAQYNTKSDYGEGLYYYDYTNVNPGKTLNYSFSYTKPGTTTSLSVINSMQPPKNSTQAGANGSSSTSNSTSKSKAPVLGVGAALVIGIAVIIAALLIFVGFKGKNSPSKSSSVSKSNKQNSNRPAVKRESDLAISEEKKELRKKLLNGKIDQETYEEEMKKLI